LSLDEVFSPEQLLYDIEMKDHVQRLVKGIDGDCDPERCLKDAMESVQQKSFVGLNTTLDAYREVYWHPSLFERQFLAGWEGEGAKTIRQRTHAMIRELLSEHEYELEPELRRELDKILAKARAELSG
jgi:trimethylamine:corrinoid methyltransferase-like protein